MTERPTSRRLRILAFDPSLDDAARDRGHQRNHRRSARGRTSSPARSANTSKSSTAIRPAASSIARWISTIGYLLAQDGLAPSESDPQFHQQMVYAVAMTTIRHFERALGRVALVGRSSDRERTRRLRRAVRPPAADLPARAARSKRVLQPAEEGAAVRLLPGHDQGRLQHAGHAGVHVPVARHRGARDDPRAARRRPPALQRAEQSGRARVPRGVRRHRGVVSAFLVSGGARKPDPADQRRPAQRKPAGPARAAVRARHRARRGAARRAGRPRRRHRRLGAAPARSARARRPGGAARRAARFSSPRCFAPSS